MHRCLHLRRSYLRAIFGPVLVFCILILASGCDKHADEKAQTSLGGRPRALMLLFGDKAEPRALPVAILSASHIDPIALDTSGWRNFDKLYFTAGAGLSVYQKGAAIGTAAVKRGMWDGNQPLYKLPGCRNARPLATVTLAAAAEGVVMYELLATTEPLPMPLARGAVTAADRDSLKVFGARAAHKEGLTDSARGELEEVLQAFPSGATPHPTFVVSYLEKGSGLTGQPRHVFMIGDYAEAQHSYATSFTHVPDSTREYRRYIDHLDLTGDGVDEIMLEAWQAEGESHLVILRFQNGHWREAMRTSSSWCDDRRQ